MQPSTCIQIPSRWQRSAMARRSSTEPVFVDPAVAMTHAGCLPGVGDEAADVAALIETIAGPVHLLVGGAINDLDAAATAYPHRHAGFVVTPGARWERGRQNAGAIDWVRDCWNALEETAAGGSYVNFITESEGRAEDAFACNRDRLVEVKTRHDPQNRFRLNQNIKPEGLQE